MNTQVPRRELLLGCGHRRQKDLSLPGHKEFENVTTVDINPDCKPDVLWDLENHPLPFEDSSFDEIHIYDVLEHLGRQGDYKFFFEEFNDYWRILKPGGHFFASVPGCLEHTVWGDPGHRRVINANTLMYLRTDTYKELGQTMLTDYRYLKKCDFEFVYFTTDEKKPFKFGLVALKDE
jgi:SAM-dependent methyltransferase